MSKYLAMAQNTRALVTGMLEKRGLQPPARWMMAERNGFVWLIGVLPTLPKLSPYLTPDVSHSLSTALKGKPVVLSNSTGLRYAILLSAKPVLPDEAQFPQPFPERDQFSLGIGFRETIAASAQEWQSMLVCGAPGSGKSTFLRLLTHTARVHGWMLYLADPDGNTYPEVWNQFAEMPVAGSLEEVRLMTERIAAEIGRRSAFYQSQTVLRGGMAPEDLDDYNRLASQPLRRVLVVMDEGNTYLGDRTIERNLAELARRGRKWGVHLVLAGHNWRSKDVSRELSSMLKTRVCFGVADDTSGEVVLDSRRWALYAMRINRSGRGVIQLGGKTQPFQAFKIEKANEIAWLASTSKLEPLSQVELEMVRVAIEELNGEFPVNRLADRLGGKISEWDVRNTAKLWEQRGWLTTPADAVSARKVTPELEKLAGFIS